MLALFFQQKLSKLNVLWFKLGIFLGKIRTLKTVSVVKDAFVNIAYFKKFFFRNEYKSLWSSYNSEENIYITNLIIFLKNYIESRQAEFCLTYFPNTTNISIDNPERKM